MYWPASTWASRHGTAAREAAEILDCAGRPHSARLEPHRIEYAGQQPGGRDSCVERARQGRPALLADLDPIAVRGVAVRAGDRDVRRCEVGRASADA